MVIGKRPTLATSTVNTQKVWRSHEFKPNISRALHITEKAIKDWHKMELFSCDFDGFHFLFDFGWILALQNNVFMIFIKFLRFSQLILPWVRYSRGNIRLELDLGPKSHCVIVKWRRQCTETFLLYEQGLSNCLERKLQSVSVRPFLFLLRAQCSFNFNLERTSHTCVWFQ